MKTSVVIVPVVGTRASAEQGSHITWDLGILEAMDANLWLQELVPRPAAS